MDIRNALNGYFEKTQVPAELDPQNVSKFVVPKVTEKKETQTSERLGGGIADGEPKSAEAPAAARPVPAPAGVSSAEAEEDGTVIGASAFIKIVRYHKLTGSEFLSILGNSKISNKAYQEIETNPGLTVKRLIELLEESPLTSADYERLIIAVQRMAALKEEAKAKIKAEPARVGSTVQFADKKPIRDEEDASSSSRKNVGYTPSVYSGGGSERDDYVEDNDGEDDEDDTDGGYDGYREEREKKKKAKGRFLFGKHKKGDYESDDEDDEDEDEDEEDDGDDGERESRGNLNGKDGGAENLRFGEKDSNDSSVKKSKAAIALPFDGEDNEDGDDSGDYGDDDEDDDDGSDYDSFGRKKKKSNKGKIIAAAVGAVALIGISFGLRYWMTGSLLPFDNTQAEEKIVSEGDIFDMLSELPAPAPAFVRNNLYSAGGIREENILKEYVCANKRFLYISDNRLYIYELIGGQASRLAVRDYGEKKLLGIIQGGERLAVISTGVSQPYSFSYNVPSESGADTVVSGTVERKETFVELLDAYAPEKEGNKVSLSGTLAAAYLHEGRIIAVTYEEMEKNAVKEDSATFMPYISDGEKHLCASDKVFMPSQPLNGGFVTVFSLNTDGSFDSASAAGGTSQLVSKNGNLLFVGQGSTLIRYDLTDGVKENGFCSLSGKISGFSGISVQDGEIRVTSLDNSAAVLNVFDSELSPVGEVTNIGVGEKLAATCFNGRETYIVTENGTCFGIDGENGVMSQSSVKITNESIYRYSDSIGIRLTAADDGSKRTGLIVSTVRLDGSLSTLYSLEISSKTVAANALDEYLSSPAEENIYYIGGNSESGVIVVPVVYFDGVCEVELFVICTVNGENGILSVNGTIIEYNRQSERIFAAVDGDTVAAVTKGMIITAKTQDGAVQGYFSTNEQP